jgi:phosphoribosyl-AMP cyclohydrolase / phosphoribosyl-ATP pyrophosphohydrolase
MAEPGGMSSTHPPGGPELRPVVVQDAADGRVLMLAWASAEALEATRRTGEAYFWSRSRRELWHKGATSGNRMAIVDIAEDCDGDALLYRVKPLGPACHTGAGSCFDEADGTGQPTFSLHLLEAVIAARADAPPGESYTARLLAGGPGRPAVKVVEEAAEVARAALAEEPAALAGEAADLLYHLLVALRSRGVTLAQVIDVLAARHRAAAP